MAVAVRARAAMERAAAARATTECMLHRSRRRRAGYCCMEATGSTVRSWAAGPDMVERLAAAARARAAAATARAAAARARAAAAKGSAAAATVKTAAETATAAGPDMV